MLYAITRDYGIVLPSWLPVVDALYQCCQGRRRAAPVTSALPDLDLLYKHRDTFSG